MSSIGEKRTPMAWQHRDMNYHQGYNDRSYNGMEYSNGRPGPSSNSDQLSYRTDKSWRTRESQPAYRGSRTPGSTGGYSRSHSGEQYSNSRPSYSSERHNSRAQSPGTTTDATSTSDDESEDTQVQRGPPNAVPPQNLYGYGGYYAPPPPSVPGFHQPGMNSYLGTMKSSKSVPAAMGTYTGDPCPVHGVAPFSMPGPMPPGPIPVPMNPPPIYGPIGPVPSVIGPRRAASIYDMRGPAGQIYGTLPHRPPGIPGDRRSMAGSTLPLPPGDISSIPPQFLPPMARPRPIVVSEDGTAEPLPVRSPPEKNGSISGLASKAAREEGKEKKKTLCKGASCVAWIIVSVIALGIIVGVMLAYIL